MMAIIALVPNKVKSELHPRSCYDHKSLIEHWNSIEDLLIIYPASSFSKHFSTPVPILLLSHIWTVYPTPSSSFLSPAPFSPHHSSSSLPPFFSHSLFFPSSLNTPFGNQTSHSHSLSIRVHNIRSQQSMFRAVLYICAPPITKMRPNAVIFCSSWPDCVWSSILHAQSPCCSLFIPSSILPTRMSTSPSIISIPSPGCRLTTTLILPLRGRNFNGMLSQVLRPMMTALVCLLRAFAWGWAGTSIWSSGLFNERWAWGRGHRLVTRAKKARSDFSEGHGRVPRKPRPSEGVVATMSVRGGRRGEHMVWSLREFSVVSGWKLICCREILYLISATWSGDPILRPKD